MEQYADRFRKHSHWFTRSGRGHERPATVATEPEQPEVMAEVETVDQVAPSAGRIANAATGAPDSFPGGAGRPLGSTVDDIHFF